MMSFPFRTRQGSPSFMPRPLGLRPLLLAAALAGGSVPAAAETQIFLIENSDGYGVDTCLADGAPCGGEVANAWCRTHDFSQALDYGRVAVTGSTGSSSTGMMTIAGNAKTKACTGRGCEPVVAIACSR
ncbi:hypothetical protein [Azorhizobium sp. AG788]|uniref:hypothetical protein n=1 Tax=Azorhizobium sp. AG788 TaxID=2183897 RepID=UPI0031387E56